MSATWGPYDLESYGEDGAIADFLDRLFRYLDLIGDPRGDVPMKVVRARCQRCGSEHAFINQSVNDVRQKVCERCLIKLVITATEGEDDTTPTTPSSIPAIERIAIAPRVDEIARRLLADIDLGE